MSYSGDDISSTITLDYEEDVLKRLEDMGMDPVGLGLSTIVKKAEDHYEAETDGQDYIFEYIFQDLRTYNRRLFSDENEILNLGEGMLVSTVGAGISILSTPVAIAAVSVYEFATGYIETDIDSTWRTRNA